MYHYNQWRLRIAKMLKPSRAECGSWDLRISNSSSKNHLIFKHSHPRTIFISLTSQPYTSKHVFKYMEIWNYCAFKNHQILEWFGMGGTLQISSSSSLQGYKDDWKCPNWKTTWDKNHQTRLAAAESVDGFTYKEQSPIPLKAPIDCSLCPQ